MTSESRTNGGAIGVVQILIAVGIGLVSQTVSIPLSQPVAVASLVALVLVSCALVLRANPAQPSRENRSQLEGQVARTPVDEAEVHPRYQFVLLQAAKGALGGAVGGILCGLLAAWVATEFDVAAVCGAILGALFGPDAAKAISAASEEPRRGLLIILTVSGAVTGLVLGSLMPTELWVWALAWGLLAGAEGFLVGQYFGVSGKAIPVFWGNMNA